MKRLIACFLLVVFGFLFYATVSSYDKTMNFAVEELHEEIQIKKLSKGNTFILDNFIYNLGDKKTSSKRITQFQEKTLSFFPEIYLLQPFSPPKFG